MAGAQPEALAGGEGAGAAAGAARELAEDRKAAGNGHFAAGDLEGALRCYGQAQAAAAAAGGERALVASLACNEALCLLRLGRPAEAEERASAALAADPASGKAAYRRALARLELGDARGALGDLQKASRLEPHSREVRLRLEEARRLSDAAPADQREVAVAVGAARAVGGAADGGGLYPEKLDLNEGRLADTYKEQRDWIKTIDAWSEIAEVAFADDDRKSQISVYMTLELWGQIDPEKSTWKVKQDKLTLRLQKRASSRSWDRWEKLRRI